ncbi:peroxynitrite isomerase THAP4 isoform X2 [Mixophyes fleayi]|uniref:peroxynitrite isomerase THAP4 isoform X2 n=1 Tax=Mixophyes fleayi TaxID=3061075 RepID=UPI003F4DC87A
MVICCAALNCTNRQGKGTRGTVSFHRFPLKDVARLCLWTAAIQRSDWTPGPYSFLCSEHFSQDSFVPRMPDQHQLLRHNAVPSLFQSGREDNSGTGGLHILRVGKRKRPPKRPPSSKESKRSLVLIGDSLLNESRHHTDINIRDDLTDTAFTSNPPKSHTASKFIFSLHSYSRSSVPSLTQNVANMDPSTHPVEERTEHSFDITNEENSKNLPTIVQDSGDFFSDVECSEGKSPQREFSGSSTLASIGRIPIQIELNHSEILESLPYQAEAPSLSCSGQDRILPQDIYSLVPDTINTLHSYCSLAKPLPSPTHQCSSQELTAGCRGGEHCRSRADSKLPDAPPLNPAVAPLVWMLGTWVSDPAGEGQFPSIPSFRYIEEAVISHIGQPMLNFMFCSSNPETGKAMHRECGFIRVKPGTNQVAFICAQNTGVVEVEEGEVQGEQLSLTSQSLGRISFAKEPHVQKISRTFRLTAEGKLEQTVSMATSTQAMAPHLRVTYKKVTS